MVIRQNRWNRVVRVTFRYDEPRHIWMSHSLPCIICIVSACLSSVPGWWRQSKWAWFPVYSRHSEPRVYRRRPAHRFNDTTQGRSGHRHYCGSVRGLSSLSCICCHTHTHPLTALCPGLPGSAGTRKWVALASAGPYLSLTSLQTDNHASTPRLSFLQARPAAQPTVSKHWRHTHDVKTVLLAASPWSSFCLL